MKTTLELRAYACEVLVAMAAQGADISKDAKRLMDYWSFGSEQSFRDCAESIIEAGQS
jgi:hypothetical protein